MEESINSYNSANNNKLFNNKQFIEALYKNITNDLKRPLSTAEKTYLQNLLRQDMPVKFRNKQPREVLDIYTTSLIARFKQNSCTYDRIDMHELNKSQIGLKAEVSQSDFTAQAAQQFSNQVVSATPRSSVSLTSNLKQEYITLDSRYRSLDNDGTLYFRWNAVYDNSDIQGGFNINQKVRDVVAIKCFPIKLPYVGTADNDYGRITMLMQEFQSQAFIAHENSKFHFVFATDVEDRWIHLRVHNYNDGLFKFATPVTQLSSLTMSFGSPLQPIVFDQDRFSMLVTDYVTNKKTYFMSPDNHNLETGDLVYISGFNTYNPPSDAPVIGAINNVYGNKITTVNNTTFYIDVDSTSIYAQGAGTITVTNGSTSVVGVGGTNFLTLFTVNDRIDVNGESLDVKAILSDTSIVVKTPYTGVTGTYNYSIDNRLPGLQTQVYFGSKRILMYFEITYIDSTSTT